ncbi:hypothetical protein J2S98_004098, partial [Arthrobacter oryzae]
MLELREAAQFDRGALGWGEWKDAALRDSKEEFSFFEEGEEVARIRIYPQYRLRAPYEELPPGVYVCVDLVVVRSDKRGKRRGPEAVALVSGHEKLPIGGHESARWRPAELPAGGHEICP